jgi:hypothetical protein
MRSLPLTKPSVVGGSAQGIDPFTATTRYVGLTKTPRQGVKAGPNGQVFRTIAKNITQKTENRLIPFRALDSRTTADRSIGHTQISLQRVC